ncbi:MAG: hypothetical protein H6719_20430 [Sandaracinaceae bacterium]|nr:hypothetical protein [Sandaracinaceae bacterium]
MKKTKRIVPDAPSDRLLDGVAQRAQEHGVTDKLYRGFFAQYAAAHLLGGVVIFAWPGVLGYVVQPAPAPSSAILAGFLSAMVGFGFAPAIFVKDLADRRRFVWACVGACFVNGGGHLYNVATGASPWSLAVLVVVGIGGFLAVLLTLLVRLRPVDA